MHTNETRIQIEANDNTDLSFLHLAILQTIKLYKKTKQKLHDYRKNDIEQIKQICETFTNDDILCAHVKDYITTKVYAKRTWFFITRYESSFKKLFMITLNVYENKQMEIKEKNSLALKNANTKIELLNTKIKLYEKQIQELKKSDSKELIKNLRKEISVLEQKLTQKQSSNNTANPNHQKEYRSEPLQQTFS